MESNIEKRLTWDEIADVYQKHTGKSARILSMDTVLDKCIENNLIEPYMDSYKLKECEDE